MGKLIKKVVVLGGSGSFVILVVKSNKVDVFVIFDVKYYDFFLVEN